MLNRIFILLLLLVASCSAHASDDVGFRQTTLAGDEPQRPLQIAIWYPTDTGQQATVVGETPAFYGQRVILNGAIKAGIHPLVVLSHGYGGSWRNLAWIAAALVSNGYVVAAPDHPGTTTFDRRPEEAAKLWRRPEDLSRVASAMLEDASLGGKIDAHRIAGIGHSLGGWTVVELAGGQFDPALLMTHCAEQFGTVACKVFESLGLRDPANASHLVGTGMKDQKFRAVVSLDLGPSRGFTQQSLAAVQVPILVLAAGEDIGTDVARTAMIAATNKDSAYLAAQLPQISTTYMTIPGALHFSFMQLCKPGAAGKIEQQSPGDGIVCQDAGGRDREAIHRQVLKLILDFLGKTMPEVSGG